jgi:hypothetical protein
MEKTWKTSYGNSDCPQQMIAEIVVEYFNELGNQLIAARKSGTPLVAYVDVNPIYVSSMRQIGLSTIKLSGSFGYGPESEVCNNLFETKGGMSYYQYIERIYKTLCYEIKGDWDYVSYENTMILRYAEKLRNEKGEVKIKHVVPSLLSDEDLEFINKNVSKEDLGADMTFKDLYKFIQIAERDEFGYYRISKHTALHIYANRTQVNVCEMDGFHGWMSMMNFVFRPDEDVVVVYTVKNGVADYAANDWKVSMDTKISHLKTTSEMKDGQRVKDIIINMLDMDNDPHPHEGTLSINDFDRDKMEKLLSEIQPRESLYIKR